MTRTIEHFVMMGDSLSDRGTMDHRKLFGIIPLDGLAGLKKSPLGRFTNGYTWDDELGAFLSEEAIIKELKSKGKSASDIADAVIDGDRMIKDRLQNDFNLDSHRDIKFRRQDYVRNYDEGGLTSYDYSERVTLNLKLLAEELILSRLSQKRELLLQDDEARGISQEHKDKTLIVEWSGANDLLTLNTKPTIKEADKAIAARVENVEKLIESGYRNFTLFNLPDISLSPRIQNKNKKDQANAHATAVHFNERLLDAVRELSRKYPDCSIDVFDVDSAFQEVYNNPEKYRFDPTKRTKAYTDSPDFKILPNHTSPAKGYMFWDDIHPSAHMHALLGDKFYSEYRRKYDFKAPHQSLLEVFRQTYGQKLLDDKRGFFGDARVSRLADYKHASLERVLEHALYEEGKRTREIITELGWINKKGELISKHPSLIKAMEEVRAHHEGKASPSQS